MRVSEPCGTVGPLASILLKDDLPRRTARIAIAGRPGRLHDGSAPGNGRRRVLVRPADPPEDDALESHPSPSDGPHLHPTRSRRSAHRPLGHPLLVMDISPPDPTRAPRPPEPRIASDPTFELAPQPRRAAAARAESQRRVCRVLPLKDAQGLGLSLVRLLDRTIPEIRFTTGRVPHGDGSSQPDWIWICGFEADHLEQVERVCRQRHTLAEGARLLVTGRAIGPSWRQALEHLGVDLALPWPYPVQALREQLLLPAPH